MTWLVVGGGLSGSSSARLLRKLGREVRLSDVTKLSDEQTAQLKQAGVSIQIGAQTPDLLNGITGVVQSPGVPPDIPLLEQARSQKIPILSEIDLALESFHGDLIGVTGTNGKSTTTVMTAHILERAGKKAVAAGNIGKPPCEIILANEVYDTWVLELSSYQLETSKSLKPKVAIFTSFTPDHLQRHKTMANYFRVKWRLLTGLPANGLALLSHEVYEAAKLYKESIPNCHYQKILRPMEPALLSKSKLWTKHDFLNASFALEAAAFILSAPIESLISYLEDFQPLEHRCEKVGSLNGQLVINDSKATNVDATLRALESIAGPCLLMLGGQAKEESFAPLKSFNDKIGKVVCFGKSGGLIESQLDSSVKRDVYPTLKLALQAIKQGGSKLSMPLLFSPACASFDEFLNFEDRGRFFKRELTSILD